MIHVDPNIGTDLQNILNPNAEYQVFDFNILKIATENFSDANKLGEGGFGPVYKVPYTLHLVDFTYFFLLLLLTDLKQNKHHGNFQGYFIWWKTNCGEKTFTKFKPRNRRV
jgi:hypothetical protein